MQKKKRRRKSRKPVPAMPGAKWWAEIFNITAKNEKFDIDSRAGLMKFDKVIIATGGRYKEENSGFDLAEKLGHTITPLAPSLCGLVVKEQWVKELSGVSFKNIETNVFINGKKAKNLKDDLLFTHQGISGPLAFKISSFFAFDIANKSNISLKLNFVDKDEKTFDQILQKSLIFHPKKSVANVISEYIPRSLTTQLLESLKIDQNKKACEFNAVERKKVVQNLTNLELSVVSTDKKGEIVTAGGVSLKEVDSKTMESKLVKGLYFCGEVLDIDGLTGGFNLQACWSTGAIAGMSSAE